jgi:hypothetical protein
MHITVTAVNFSNGPLLTSQTGLPIPLQQHQVSPFLVQAYVFIAAPVVSLTFTVSFHSIFSIVCLHSISAITQ